jgi:hypothetical protein
MFFSSDERGQNHAGILFDFLFTKKAPNALIFS